MWRSLRRAPDHSAALRRRLLSSLPEEGLLYTESIDFGAASSDRKTAVVLHGLLGVGRNLRSFVAKCFAQAAADSGVGWRAVLVDLRNHGKSAPRPGFAAPHSMESAAADVVRTLAALDGQAAAMDALLGHSLGGKVALTVARQLREGRPLPPPRQLWVLDSQPGRAPGGQRPAGDDVAKVMDAITQVPLPVPSREWLYEHLQQRGFSKDLQAWLGSNLVLQRGGGKGYAWNFNLPGAQEMAADYSAADAWDVVRCPPAGSEVHLVRAADSNRWEAGAWEELAREVAAAAGAGHACGTSFLHELPDAGHWLHVDNPAGLAGIMLPHLAKL